MILGCDILDKIKRYLESSNYYNIYADSSLFENYIQNLTEDDVMKIVISLNKMLRNKEDEEVVSDNMIAGELYLSDTSFAKYKKNMLHSTRRKCAKDYLPIFLKEIKASKI